MKELAGPWPKGDFPRWNIYTANEMQALGEMSLLPFNIDQLFFMIQRHACQKQSDNAMLLLSSLATDQETSQLKHLLIHPQMSIRHQALGAIISIRGAEETNLLIEALNGDWLEDKSQVIHLLQAIGDDRALFDVMGYYALQKPYLEAGNFSYYSGLSLAAYFFRLRHKYPRAKVLFEEMSPLVWNLVLSVGTVTQPEFQPMMDQMRELHTKEFWHSMRK